LPAEALEFAVEQQARIQALVVIGLQPGQELGAGVPGMTMRWPSSIEALLHNSTLEPSQR